MKKTVFRFAALAAALCLTACSGEKKDSEAVLYEKGLEIAETIDQMAESDGYIQMMSVSEEINTGIKEIGEKDFSQPDGVYKIRVTGDQLDQMLYLAGSETSELPEDLREDIRRRMLTALPTQISAQSGSSALVMTSLLTAEEHFHFKGLEDYQWYLYLYGEDCGVAVTFLSYEEDIVEACGRIILHDGLKEAADSEELKKWLEECGGISVEEIEPVSYQDSGVKR